MCIMILLDNTQELTICQLLFWVTRLGLLLGTKRFSQNFAGRRPYSTYMDARRRSPLTLVQVSAGIRDIVLWFLQTGGRWIWLAYWKEPSPSPAFLTDLRTRRDALFAGSPRVALDPESSKIVY
jgi:hypothetical protein